MKLNSSRQISWNLGSQAQGVVGLEVHFGKGPQPIQVAVAESPAAPTRSQLKALFAERKGSLNTLIVVVKHGDQASLFGPDADTEVMRQSLETTEAILNSILDQPNEILAYQRATSIWRSKQTTELVGFTNNGLFASHYIRSSINHHSKWKTAQETSRRIQNLRDQELITALGFEITATPSSTLVLRAKGQDHRAVAILLDQTESFDTKSAKLQASPVEWSLAVAAEQGAPWVIAIRDSQLRLYPAKDGVGVGQKSQAETYFEIDLLTIDEDKAGLLDLIFSAEALAEGGTADELLANSRKFAVELGVRLRERVYESVVPVLATEVANQLRNKGHELDAKGLQLSYEITLRILFRLLFQAYAEDRGLLPSGRNENFDKNSIKYWAQYLLERDIESPYGEASTIWFDLIQVWDAIDQGNPDMQIPAYNGGLFGSSPDLHPEGALIRTLSIPDRVLGPALRALVIDDNSEDGVPGAVDFRSLSVREFGTIYEGLLESSLSVADQDLTVDKSGAWVPAQTGDVVLAKSGDVYFHSASGERKATGSYYTPSFIVDHLIERSVEPALNEHLERVKTLIESGDQASAYKKFFDFRVADLAMGSAHFLVAAIDKIESIMRTFLLQPGNEIDGVSAELMRLEAAAREALGKDEAAYAEIERASLLRRQIARRCVYGLDINPMAVELSRLAIWIHTFVPGLPMSSLEHNLVCANSLTGIASQEEGLNALIPERLKQGTSFVDPIVESALNEASFLLEDVANADEASKAEAQRAAESVRMARELASKSKMVFDLAVANRAGVISSNSAMTEQDLIRLTEIDGLSELIEELQPAHMPYLFPEVFLRENPGFDVLVGNPPWERPVVDKSRFWTARFPGLLSLNPREKAERVAELELLRPDLAGEFEAASKAAEHLRDLLNARFSLGGMDADFYKAFSSVSLRLLRNHGFQALVLPKTAFSAFGGETWRRQLHDLGSIMEVTFLINTGRWAFDIEARYSIGLFTYQKGIDSNTVLKGPVHSKRDFIASKSSRGVLLDRVSLLTFTEVASVPVVADQQTADTLAKMRLSPSFKDSCGGAYKLATDFNATSDRRKFDHGEHGNIPVFSGRSFNIWTLVEDQIFAWAIDSSVESTLRERFLRQRVLRSSPFFGFDLHRDLKGQLPFRRSRISYRSVSNPTNSRTIIACLIPPDTITTHINPYILTRCGNEKLEAYLLGVLSSLPFDWYARKFVETAVDKFLLNAFPVPDWKDTPLFEAIVANSVKLSAQDSRHKGWASAFNYTPRQLGSEERTRLVAELDGLVAAAYGLNAIQLEHIFDSFHRGWSDPERLSMALETLEEATK